MTEFVLALSHHGRLEMKGRTGCSGEFIGFVAGILSWLFLLPDRPLQHTSLLGMLTYAIAVGLIGAILGGAVARIVSCLARF